MGAKEVGATRVGCRWWLTGYRQGSTTCP